MENLRFGLMFDCLRGNEGENEALRAMVRTVCMVLRYLKGTSSKGIQCGSLPRGCFAFFSLKKFCKICTFFKATQFASDVQLDHSSQMFWELSSMALQYGSLLPRLEVESGRIAFSVA